MLNHLNNFYNLLTESDPGHQYKSDSEVYASDQGQGSIHTELLYTERLIYHYVIVLDNPLEIQRSW